MKAIFGTGYDQLAMQYGKTVTQAATVVELERLFQLYLDKDMYGKKLKESGNENILSNLSGYAFGSAFDEAKNLGDNKTDIQSWIYDFTRSKRAEYSDKVKADQQAAKAAEIEALKSDPNFKEVPEAVRNAFDQIGIIVKTNMEQVVIPGFKGKGGTPAAPFSKWFIQDKYGKSGKLFRVKEILKARYGASFFQDAGGDFDGAWWHVAVTVDLAEVYKIMA